MIRQTLWRVAGTSVLIGGMLAIVLGKAHLRSWRILPGFCGRFIAFLLAFPGLAIRLLGVGEILLGLAALGAAPFPARQVYRYAAGSYDQFRALWRRAVASKAEEAVDSAVRQYLPPGGKVLDLGCGTGANLERLLRLQLPFGSYTGVDLSPEMLAVARRKYAGIPIARFWQADLTQAALPDGDYDLVISTWLLSLIPQPLLLADNALRKTKLGGHVILLFLSRSRSWLDPIAGLLLAPISAHPVPQEICFNFPCCISIRRFNAGLVTLTILRNVKMSDLAE